MTSGTLPVPQKDRNAPKPYYTLLHRPCRKVVQSINLPAESPTLPIPASRQVYTNKSHSLQLRARQMAGIYFFFGCVLFRHHNINPGRDTPILKAVPNLVSPFSFSKISILFFLRVLVPLVLFIFRR